LYKPQLTSRLSKYIFPKMLKKLIIATALLATVVTARCMLYCEYGLIPGTCSCRPEPVAEAPKIQIE
ncbi:hypothetical protein BGX26_004559, partial [Mortierella sp. AD094]